MSSAKKQSRKSIVRELANAPMDAGVYRIVNEASGRSLLATTHDVASAKNRFAFAQATNSASALDQRLASDIAAHGVASFRLEVLETVRQRPEMTTEELRAEIAALESLWRERLTPAGLY